MARRRFFADAMSDGRLYLRGRNAAHLATVLRAKPGQQYEVVHEGRVYLARIVSLSPGEVAFEFAEPSLGPTPPPENPPQRSPQRSIDEHDSPAAAPQLVLAAAIFKFDRFEWMIEKATELGVDLLQPLTTRRADVKLAAAAVKRVERWRRLAAAAAEQSRRSSIPAVAEPLSLGVFLKTPFAGQQFLLSERPGATALRSVLSLDDPATFLIGPEGGWTESEFDVARKAGYAEVSLGPRILRCETAALAALAQMLI